MEVKLDTHTSETDGVGKCEGFYFSGNEKEIGIATVRRSRVGNQS